MMNPSDMLRQVLRETGLPKFSIITHLFAEYTGYAMDDPKLYSIMLTLMAPFAMALLGSYHGLQKESPLQIPGEVMAENLKKLTGGYDECGGWSHQWQGAVRLQPQRKARRLRKQFQKWRKQGQRQRKPWIFPHRGITRRR